MKNFDKINILKKDGWLDTGHVLDLIYKKLEGIGFNISNDKKFSNCNVQTNQRVKLINGIYVILPLRIDSHYLDVPFLEEIRNIPVTMYEKKKFFKKLGIPDCFAKPINYYSSVRMSSFRDLYHALDDFKTIMKKLKKNEKNFHVKYITPVHVHGNHWVGLILEYNKGKYSYTYMNSMSCKWGVLIDKSTIEKVENEIEKKKQEAKDNGVEYSMLDHASCEYIIHKMLHAYDITEENDKEFFCKQTDFINCGFAAVKNLFMNSGILKGENDDTGDAVKQMRIECQKEFPEWFEEYYIVKESAIDSLKSTNGVEECQKDIQEEKQEDGQNEILNELKKSSTEFSYDFFENLIMSTSETEKIDNYFCVLMKVFGIEEKYEKMHNFEYFESTLIEVQ